jgi:hypothetical protein
VFIISAVYILLWGKISISSWEFDWFVCTVTRTLNAALYTDVGYVGDMLKGESVAASV